MRSRSWKAQRNGVKAPRSIDVGAFTPFLWALDRKSTRLNSSHVRISYAVFCLKKKKKPRQQQFLSIVNATSNGYNIVQLDGLSCSVDALSDVRLRADDPQPSAASTLRTLVRHQ